MRTPAIKPDGVPLAYGRRVPLYRRHWVRLCLCGLLLSTAGGIGWAAWQRRGIPWLQERERLRSVQRERTRVEALKHDWMTYREPADQAVFAEPAGPAGDLPPCRKAWPFGPTHGDIGFGGAPHGFRARADEEAVLFLHRRHNPAGHERVVLLVVQRQGGGPAAATQPALGRVLRFCYTIVDLTAWSGKPQPVVTSMSQHRPDPAIRGGGGWLFPPTWQRLQNPIRLFAGQPDPDDPTHFTIRYEYNGQPGTVDGYVQDPATPRHGERIRFVVRDGPAAGPGDPITFPATRPTSGGWGSSVRGSGSGSVHFLRGMNLTGGMKRGPRGRT